MPEPAAVIVFDGEGLSTDPQASGRRMMLDARCLGREPVPGAFAHVCASADEGAALRFDEPEVQQTRRDALAWWIALLGDDLICLSTLALDGSLCAGAVTVARTPARFHSDPFRRLFAGTVVQTGPLLPRGPAAGPGNRALLRRAMAGGHSWDQRRHCP